MLDDLPLDQITDPQARDVIRRLLNGIETLRAENDRLKGEVQLLRDEIHRLKGTPGRPKGLLGQPPAQHVSSETERRVHAGGYVRRRTPRSPLTVRCHSPLTPPACVKAELGCRARVRKRDVRFGPGTDAGIRAWDVGLT